MIDWPALGQAPPRASDQGPAAVWLKQWPPLWIWHRFTIRCYSGR
ncbi:hypothetical protein [Paenibacillus dendritiformis]